MLDLRPGFFARFAIAIQGSSPHVAAVRNSFPVRSSPPPPLPRFFLSLSRLGCGKTAEQGERVHPTTEASSHASSFMRSWERASRWVRSTPPSFPASLSPSPFSWHMLAGRFIFSCLPSPSVSLHLPYDLSLARFSLAPVSTSSSSPSSSFPSAPAIPHPRPLQLRALSSYSFFPNHSSFLLRCMRSFLRT